MVRFVIGCAQGIRKARGADGQGLALFKSDVRMLLKQHW